jgi:S-formylglutathione hydrolase
MALTLIEEHRCFGGCQAVYRHPSQATGTVMEFAIFLPERSGPRPSPLLTYLSGLTCSWANATEKAGAQRFAAAHGLAVVFPDTSPRGTDLPGEHDAYDFGSGAGFYIDATAEPWSQHYRMYSYITEELPALIADALPVDPTRQGLFGHSMGGHGALTIAFKNPRAYRSLSAFAPIVAAARVPWGENALAGYLGPDRDEWLRHDACALVAGSGWSSPILIDQGLADPFLKNQLRPELLEAACAAAGVPLTVRRHPGYDHSYYFISTFIADHIAHHAALLKGAL